MSKLLATLSWVILAACIAKMWTLVPEIPVHIDEGYNLLVPQTLAHAGVYGTASEHFTKITPLNPRITTGPTVLIPIGGIFSLGFESLEAARTVMLLYFAGCAAAAFLCFKEQLGSAAPLAAAMLCTVPAAPLLFIPVLGESAALFFLFLAAHCACRRPAARYLAAGFAFGLAIVTKYQSALFLPAFLIELGIRLSKRELRSRDTALFVTGLIAPLTLAVLALYSFGGRAGLEAYWSFFTRYSGNALLQPQGFWRERLATLWNWSIPFAATVTAGLFMSFALRRIPVFRLFGLMNFSVLVWWICCSQNGWGRHVVPALSVGAVLSLASAALIVRDRPLNLFRRTIAGLVLALLAVLVFDFLTLTPRSLDLSQSYAGETPKGVKFGEIHAWRRAELEAAAFLRTMPQEAAIYSAGTFRDARFDILTGRNLGVYSPEISSDTETPVLAVTASFDSLYGNGEKAGLIVKHLESRAVAARNFDRYRVFGLNRAGAHALGAPLQVLNAAAYQ